MVIRAYKGSRGWGGGGLRSCGCGSLAGTIDERLVVVVVYTSAVASCGSTFRQIRARVEYYLARNSNWWYYLALAIAMAINVIMFFWGSSNMDSSIGCPLNDDDFAGLNCTNRHVFHWVNQGWSPNQPG